MNDIGDHYFNFFAGHSSFPKKDFGCFGATLPFGRPPLDAFLLTRCKQQSYEAYEAPYIHYRKHRVFVHAPRFVSEHRVIPFKELLVHDGTHFAVRWRGAFYN